MRAFFSYLWVPLLLLAGCGLQTDPEDNGTRAAIELVRSDLAHLQATEDTGGDRFDARYGNGFTQVFGGTRGEDVQRYFELRIRHLVGPGSSLETLPGRFRYTAWSQDPKGPVTGRNEKAELGAANIGTGLWLMGLINQVAVTAIVDGERIPVSSSRAGIMFIGPGYQPTLTVRGRQLQLPSSFREAILVHEARHSDCTGGVTRAALQVARQVGSQREFTEKFPNRACGHLHIYCPPDHELADLPACDGEAWGAYSVGAVYARAGTYRTGLAPMEWEVLNAAAIDSMSRLVGVDGEPMLRGRYGRPDMSSGGLNSAARPRSHHARPLEAAR